MTLCLLFVRQSNIKLSAFISKFSEWSSSYVLSHNLNEETIKCQKDLAFSTSINSMMMSNFSAKENANVENKSKNDSGIQDDLKEM